MRIFLVEDIYFVCNLKAPLSLCLSTALLSPGNEWVAQAANPLPKPIST